MYWLTIKAIGKCSNCVSWPFVKAVAESLCTPCSYRSAQGGSCTLTPFSGYRDLNPGRLLIPPLEHSRCGAIRTHTVGILNTVSPAFGLHTQKRIDRFSPINVIEAVQYFYSPVVLCNSPKRQKGECNITTSIDLEEPFISSKNHLLSFYNTSTHLYSLGEYPL